MDKNVNGCLHGHFTTGVGGCWSPFVGVFIARVSKGRSIREFISGVLLVPAIVSFIWFSVFGVLGIETGKKHPDYLK